MDVMDVKARTGSLSPGDQGLAQVADVEHGWCLDIIPVFLGEWIDTARENTRVNRYKLIFIVQTLTSSYTYFVCGI